MKILSKIIAVFLLLFLNSFGIWHLSHAQSIAKTQNIPSTFQGDFLAISDADMIATAYANGILNKVAQIEDTLFYASLKSGKPSIQSKIHASNSVISWPAILEWHPNKKYAYVAETRAIYKGEEQKMSDVFVDFPKGLGISIIDFSVPSSPKIVQDTVIGENIQNVSINKAGDLLVAGSTEKGKELIIATLEEGRIDQVFYFSDPEINEADNRDGGFRTIEFHPTANVIATNLNGTNVAFYKIIHSGSGLELEKSGNSIKVCKKCSVGNWHPSGQFFILSDVAWGQGALGYVLNGKGKLISTKYSAEGDHEVVSTLKVGLSPEGFDISPDGKYAVAVNMRRTYGPKQFWFVPGRKKASLSLIKINAETGVLSKLGKAYGFKGALPEDAIFDKKSNALAVAIYQEQDELYPKQSWIDFWEIKEDRLIKTETKLYVTRGVHNLLLIP